MIKYRQTLFGEQGNCFSTCIASILELPLKDVPHFCDFDDWLGETNAWLRERGLCYLEMPYPYDRSGSELIAGLGYHLIHGLGPRGLLHSCVGYAGKIVHDPHPSDAGLLREDEIGILMPLDPSLSKRRLTAAQHSGTTSRL